VNELLDFLPWHFAGATFWRRGGQFGVCDAGAKAQLKGVVWCFERESTTLFSACPVRESPVDLASAWKSFFKLKKRVSTLQKPNEGIRVDFRSALPTSLPNQIEAAKHEAKALSPDCTWRSREASQANAIFVLASEIPKLTMNGFLLYSMNVMG